MNIDRLRSFFRSIISIFAVFFCVASGVSCSEDDDDKYIQIGEGDWAKYLDVDGSVGGEAKFIGEFGNLYSMNISIGSEYKFPHLLNVLRSSGLMDRDEGGNYLDSKYEAKTYKIMCLENLSFNIKFNNILKVNNKMRGEFAIDWKIKIPDVDTRSNYSGDKELYKEDFINAIIGDLSLKASFGYDITKSLNLKVGYSANLIKYFTDGSIGISLNCDFKYFEASFKYEFKYLFHKSHETDGVGKRIINAFGIDFGLKIKGEKQFDFGNKFKLNLSSNAKLTCMMKSEQYKKKK